MADVTLAYGGVHRGSGSGAVRFRGLSETDPTSLILGLTALGILLFGKTVLKHRPVALLVVVFSIIAAARTPMSGFSPLVWEEVGPPDSFKNTRPWTTCSRRGTADTKWPPSRKACNLCVHGAGVIKM